MFVKILILVISLLLQASKALAKLAKVIMYYEPDADC